MLMNVLVVPMTVMKMLLVSMNRVHLCACVWMVMKEMEKYVKVMHS